MIQTPQPMVASVDAHGGDLLAHAGVTLDFSVNLSPLGLQPQVIDALLAATPTFDAYPDPHCRALTAATAQMENIAPERICFGNGAADLIIRLCTALRPKHALVTAPAFSEYEKAVLEVGGTVSHHQLSPENGYQITAAMADSITAQMDMVFLCNPNNPTGRLATADAIPTVLAKCAQVGAILVVDECFLSFTDAKSCKNLLESYDNLIVLKAFTKMYCMAGLRLGYVLTSPVLRDTIAKYGQSWSVSTPAQVAGVAALQLTDLPARTRVAVDAERAWLVAQLADLPITPLPADANFMLLQTERDIWQPLHDLGILTRNCTNFHGLQGHYVRIGLKNRPENVQLVEALRRVTGEGMPWNCQCESRTD